MVVGLPTILKEMYNMFDYIEAQGVYKHSRARRASKVSELVHVEVDSNGHTVIVKCQVLFASC